MKTIKSCALAVSFLILSPLVATADTILINFSGTINFSANVSAIPEGTPYSGQLVYTLPSLFLGSNATDAQYFYDFNGAGDGLTVSIGSYTFSSVGTLGNRATVSYESNAFGLNGNDVLEFADDEGGPPYAPTGNLPGLTLLVLDLQLVGSPAFVPSPALPEEVNFADLLLGSGEFHTAVTLSFDEGGLLGTVDSIQLIHVVPEPSTINLTALAVVGAGFAAWRRKGRRGSPSRALAS